MGPSATAAWRRIEISGSVGVLVLPDAANERGGREPLFYYITASPQLAEKSEGGVQLSFTLELSRSPATGEKTILPLVQRGWLTLTIALGLSAAEFTALEAAVGSPCRPLFVRSARVELASKKTVLASAEGAGADPPIALSANLDREAALAVLAALDGIAAGLSVKVAVTYRTAPTATKLRLKGFYAKLHEFLTVKCDAEGLIDRQSLLTALGEMLRRGILSATYQKNADVPPSRWTDLDALFPRFVSAASPILESHDGGSRFSLRRSPNPLMPLDLSEQVTNAAESRWATAVGLEKVLGGVLDEHDRDLYIHLVAPGSRGAMIPVPRLVRSRRAPARFRGPERSRIRLDATNRDRYSSLALVMTPDRSRSPSAHALLATDLVRTEGPLRLLGLADDFIIERLEGDSATRPFPLPVVVDADAPAWPDRVNSAKYWYAPAWTVVAPSPSDDPTTAAFAFVYNTSGVTGGAVPAVGLEGEVQFTLERGVSEATKARLTELGNPVAEPLPILNLSVSLELPFRDETTGEVRRQLFAAELVQDGDGPITVRVALLNQWLRLCYGALAYPGFQQEPARLRVAYSYRAYVPIDDGRLELAFGGKIALTEIAAVSEHLPEPVIRPVFDPGRVSFHLPHGVLQLDREAPARRSRPHLAASHLVAAHAIASPALAPVTAIVARPELAIDVAEIIAQNIRYATRTFVRDEPIDVLYPCASLGAFYRQVEDGLESAIGCRDTLRLGETVHRQYDELVEHRDARYRVYRSLQQPGRFLVVPAVYRITRYAASEPPERAYRPAIMIYAILGKEPTEHSYFFRATLEPDIPPFARRALEDRLAPLIPHDGALVLTYPTDPTLHNSETPAGFRWALPDGIELPEVLQTWDGFQVSLSTGLANAVALTTLIESSGLAGDVTFTLPDGRTVTSTLMLDTTVAGPWEAGAVSVDVSGTTATVTNHTERQMNVFEIALGAGSSGRRVPVDLTLDPGAAVDVSIEDEAQLAYASYEPAGERVPLSRMNVFIEDVTTNVIFVNLINYANHDLVALHVKARLEGASQQQVVELNEGASASLTLTLPLTTYLDRKILEYQIDKTFAGQEAAETTPWMKQDLTVANVISLTWELIA
jgi:hypothetical protein